MGQGALSKPDVQWWLSLNSSSGDTPVLQSPGDRRREQHKRKPRLIFTTSASQAPKIALKEKQTGRPRPEEFALGSHGGRGSRRARFATISHDLPCHDTRGGDFGSRLGGGLHGGNGGFRFVSLI